MPLTLFPHRRDPRTGAAYFHDELPCESGRTPARGSSPCLRRRDFFTAAYELAPLVPLWVGAPAHDPGRHALSNNGRARRWCVHHSERDDGHATATTQPRLPPSEATGCGSPLQPVLLPVPITLSALKPLDCGSLPSPIHAATVPATAEAVANVTPTRSVKWFTTDICDGFYYLPRARSEVLEELQLSVLLWRQTNSKHHPYTRRRQRVVAAPVSVFEEAALPTARHVGPVGESTGRQQQRGVVVTIYVRRQRCHPAVASQTEAEAQRGWCALQQVNREQHSRRCAHATAAVGELRLLLEEAKKEPGARETNTWLHGLLRSAGTLSPSTWARLQADSGDLYERSLLPRFLARLRVEPGLSRLPGVGTRACWALYWWRAWRHRQRLKRRPEGQSNECHTLTAAQQALDAITQWSLTPPPAPLRPPPRPRSRGPHSAFPPTAPSPDFARARLCLAPVALRRRSGGAAAAAEELRVAQQARAGCERHKEHTGPPPTVDAGWTEEEGQGRAAQPLSEPTEAPLVSAHAPYPGDTAAVLGVDDAPYDAIRTERDPIGGCSTTNDGGGGTAREGEQALPPPALEPCEEMDRRLALAAWWRAAQRQGQSQADGGGFAGVGRSAEVEGLLPYYVPPRLFPLPVVPRARLRPVGRRRGHNAEGARAALQSLLVAEPRRVPTFLLPSRCVQEAVAPRRQSSPLRRQIGGAEERRGCADASGQPRVVLPEHPTLCPNWRNLHRYRIHSAGTATAATVDADATVAGDDGVFITLRNLAALRLAQRRAEATRRRRRSTIGCERLRGPTSLRLPSLSSSPRAGAATGDGVPTRTCGLPPEGGASLVDARGQRELLGRLLRPQRKSRTGGRRRRRCQERLYDCLLHNATSTPTLRAPAAGAYDHRVVIVADAPYPAATARGARLSIKSRAVCQRLLQEGAAEEAAVEESDGSGGVAVAGAELRARGRPQPFFCRACAYVQALWKRQLEPLQRGASAQLHAQTSAALNPLITKDLVAVGVWREGTLVFLSWYYDLLDANAEDTVQGARWASTEGSSAASRRQCLATACAKSETEALWFVEDPADPFLWPVAPLTPLVTSTRFMLRYRTGNPQSQASAPSLAQEAALCDGLRTLAAEVLADPDHVLRRGRCCRTVFSFPTRFTDGVKALLTEAQAATDAAAVTQLFAARECRSRDDDGDDTNAADDRESCSGTTDYQKPLVVDRTHSRHALPLSVSLPWRRDRWPGVVCQLLRSLRAAPVGPQPSRPRRVRRRTEASEGDRSNDDAVATYLSCLLAAQRQEESLATQLRALTEGLP